MDIEFKQTGIKKNQQNQQYGTEFIRNIKIEVISKQEGEIEFDIVGIDASIANALRRIMISEIPTMAIERVDIYMNTSIIADEILSHRLGLIPILADPREFQFKQTDEDYNQYNTIKLKLHVKCTRKKQYVGATYQELQKMQPEQYLDNCNVYADQFEWVPLGNQNTKFTYQQVGPIYPKVLVAKLRENQEIELECFCEKNIGKVHAKWQAVQPASYRLMPNVRIDKKIKEVEEMQKLVDICPMKVFEIKKKKRQSEVVVARPRDCTMCRECIREEVDQDQKTVTIGKVPDHYIFNIEAVGMLDCETIFLQAIEIFKNKVSGYINNFNENEYM